MTTPLLGKGLGLLRDRQDDRDLKFSITEHGSYDLATTGPDIIDLTARVRVPVFDQGPIGSCTANMASYLDVYNRIVEGLHDTYVASGGASRLGIYYYTRLAEGTPTEDSGASIRDTIKTLNKYGACSESNWPYNVAKFAVEPSEWATTNMSHHKVHKYLSVDPSEEAIDSCLAAGYPIGYGMAVFSSFEAVGQDGIVPLPVSTDTILGGHALCIVGRNRLTRYYKIRNSWSPMWGAQGYCYLPYDYIFNKQLAYDFWTLRLLD